MQIMPVCFAHDDVLVVLIRKAENGFIVNVNYPSSMINNAHADSIKSFFSSIAGIHDNPNIDQASFIKSLGEAFAKATHPPKPIRSAHEEYVFQSMDRMIAFVRETFESADPAPNQDAK
jgi:hypothetical protein